MVLSGFPLYKTTKNCTNAVIRILFGGWVQCRTSSFRVDGEPTSYAVAWQWPLLWQSHLLPPRNLCLIPDGIGKYYIFLLKVKPLGNDVLQNSVCVALWLAPEVTCEMNFITGLQNWAPFFMLSLAMGTLCSILLGSNISGVSDWENLGLWYCFSLVTKILCPETENFLQA